MEITFNAHGNKKQIEAFKYWVDPTVEDIVYGGSKACQPGHQLVKTKLGRRRIDSLRPGDIVLTTNEKTGNK